ncbi:adenylate/guanylate cyclase domain-containing protein [Desulfonatronospira sp.]|uniref:CHASE2 domain-containing protein n=1 Tax=Desulfonatronospira sp. TaxID=1962951 RepID=UPI0025BFF5A1|nr:adenylate/guanylate cyclase domain-containing protein [Desulfonatronospira sp.]
MTIAVLIAFIAAGRHPLSIQLENHALDFFYRLHGPAAVPDDFLIVAIDEPSFQMIHASWPWPRSLHASLVDRLDSAGARLIVMDIVFAEKSDPLKDEQLSISLGQSGKVVLAKAIDIVEDPEFFRIIHVDPLDILQHSAKGVGLAVLTPDLDGVVRRFSPRYGDQWTLPGAAFLALEQEEQPVADDLSGLIDYVGPARTMPTVSYYQVLDPDRPLPDKFIKDKIVFVGMSLAVQSEQFQQADSYATPFFSSQGGFMSGVEIQANILWTMLSGRAGNIVSYPVHTGICAILLGMIALCTLRQNPLTGLVIIAILLVSFFSLTFILFVHFKIWMEPVRIMAAGGALFGLITLGDFLSEIKTKIWTRKALSRYLAPRVVEHIIRNPQMITLGGEEVQATVLMSDLAGFTALSEDLPPAKLIELLSDFFTPATEIIIREEGTLDKYLGDSVMAFWGAPLHIKDHAQRAARSALAIDRVMENMKREKEIQGLPFFSNVKTGLHSGRVVVGNVGSYLRYDYTCLGDTVNLASRLESLNRHYGTRILMSEATRNLLGDGFLVRNVDTVMVLGRSQKLTVYELLDHTLHTHAQWMEIFEQALGTYQRGAFAEAAEGFQKVLDIKPEDGPAGTLLARCRRYVNNPPSDWQGVFVMDKK